MAASWRSQADPGLGTAHLECADLAPELLGYVVCPHATPLYHFWDGSEYCLRQNYTSHFDHPLTILVRCLVASLTLWFNSGPMIMRCKLDWIWRSLVGRNETSKLYTLARRHP